MMLGNALWESTLQRHVPAAALSRVSSYDWFGSMAFAPVGLILWGPVAAAIGLRAALWSACALLVLSHLAMLAVADIRRVGGVPAPTRQEPSPAAPSTSAEGVARPCGCRSSG